MPAGVCVFFWLSYETDFGPDDRSVWKDVAGASQCCASSESGVLVIKSR